MSWWFHLLVRRVEALKERALLAERLFRAVGTFRYAERAEMILVDFEVDPYHLFTIGKVYRCRVRRSREEDFFGTVTSPCDAPAVLYVGGSLDWRRNGKCFRGPGKPAAMWVDGRFLYYSVPRSDGNGYVLCEWTVGADEMYRLLREGFK